MAYMAVIRSDFYNTGVMVYKAWRGTNLFNTYLRVLHYMAVATSYAVPWDFICQTLNASAQGR